MLKRLLQKIGSWSDKHNGEELSVTFGLSMDALLFSTLRKYYPIKFPSDIWSSSVVLGQGVFCMWSPFLAMALYLYEKKKIRYRGNQIQGAFFVFGPPWLVIGSVVPAVATTAISALLGYTCRFFSASKQRMVALAVPCFLGSWKVATNVKRKREREEQRKREAEKRREQYKEHLESLKKRRQEQEQAKEAARQAAKAHALAKFDAAAKDGKIEKVHFAEALQPYVLELVQRIPVEEFLKKEFPEELAMKFLPIADVAREDAAHIVDCDAFLELLFGLIDKNGDGSIERSELEVLIDELLELNVEANPRVFQQSIAALAFRFVDRNKDGKVELSEAEFLLNVILQLTGFAVSTGLHVANAIVETPVVEEEIGKLISQNIPFDTREELLSFTEPLKAKNKEYAPDDFWRKFGLLDPAVVYKGLLSLIDAISAIHHATETSEDDPVTNFYLTVNELLRGGINEKSFVGMLAPMIKKRMMAKPDLNGLKNSLQGVKTSQGGSWPTPECEELEKKFVSAIEKQWGTVFHTIVAAQGNAAEVATSCSSALFELADIDCDGKISQREISIIKSFFNSFVNIAVVMTLRHESDSKEALPGAFKRKLKELCPAAFTMADDKDVHLVNLYTDSLFQMLVDGFDFLDKNADGKVTKEEMGGLVVKLLRVALRLVKSLWDSYLAGASAFSLDALKEVWKQADISEVTMENFPVVAASVQATMCL